MMNSVSSVIIKLKEFSGSTMDTHCRMILNKIYHYFERYSVLCKQIFNFRMTAVIFLSSLSGPMSCALR